MHRHVVLFALLLSLSAPAFAAAQSGIGKGTRVRVTRTDGSRIQGRLTALDPDRVTLDPEGGTVLALPATSVRLIEMSRGKRRRLAAWMIGGASVTGVALGAWSAATWEPCESTGWFGCFSVVESTGEALALGFVGGAVLGGLGGLVVGLVARHEHWVAVDAFGTSDPTASLTVMPRADGSVSVGVTLRLGRTP